MLSRLRPPTKTASDERSNFEQVATAIRAIARTPALGNRNGPRSADIWPWAQFLSYRELVFDSLSHSDDAQIVRPLSARMRERAADPSQTQRLALQGTAEQIQRLYIAAYQRSACRHERRCDAVPGRSSSRPEL